MVADAIARVMSEYPDARNADFAGHPLAQFIRHDLPDLLRSRLPQFSQIDWRGSAGQGNWADGPWVAAFDPVVTDTAQRGFYPVYLFARSCDRVCLSMNQGITLLKDEYGADGARSILTHRADIIRSRVHGQYESRFPLTTISLQPSDRNSVLSFYESGHAFGKQYNRGAVPATEVLLQDMATMLMLYHQLIRNGGVDQFDTDATDGAGDETGMSLDERKRYRFHRSIERNRRLAQMAKKVHGYACQVCGFEFSSAYGDLGTGYIEAHHLTPLSELPEGGPIARSPRDDFAVVCANCHRIIHRNGAPADFAEFKRYYEGMSQ